MAAEPEVMNIRRTPFELASSQGDPIRGDVWSREGMRAGAAIVICHGFKGFKDWGFFPYTAESLAKQTGYPAITFNFSGNGVGPDLLDFTELDRFERNTFSKELDDLDVVLDAAEAGKLPELEPRGRFGLLGHSRGGVSTLITASEDNRVACLVTWSAVSYLDRWSDDQKKEWRRTGRIEILNSRTGQMMPLGVVLLEDYERNLERLNLLTAASSLRVPYLVIHGSKDEAVRIADGESLARAGPSNSTRFERIAGAGHTFGAVHPFKGTTEHLTRVIDLTADWFVKNLRS